LNGKHQFLVYADTVHLVDVKITYNERNRNAIENLKGCGSMNNDREDKSYVCMCVCMYVYMYLLQLSS
jgi:hypothetical protein